MTRLCFRGHGYYSGKRCPGCERDRDQRRGTPTQRGYDGDHYRAKATLAGMLPTPCGYCRGLLTADSPWVAAHVVDGQPEYGWMAAHPACNERAKQRSRRTALRKVQSVSTPRTRC